MIQLPTATSSPVPIIGAVLTLALMFVAIGFHKVGKTFVAAGVFGVALLITGVVVVFGLGLLPS